jgi:hypothetical protein
MIPVLFTAKNSLYLKDDRFDCFGQDRDAMTWKGNTPAIYHPPCRLFSKMRAFSTAGKCEKFYGYYSIMSAREFGGIVEQPKASSLYKEMGCDLSGSVDQFGGFIRSVNLSWFGYPAQKETLIYVVGVLPGDLPAHPLCFNAIQYMIGCQRRNNKPDVPMKMRAQTPQPMIDWFHEIIKQIEK